jgi:hypothetical protein
MLKKQKLRAFSAGQWARVRVPDYECWRGGFNHTYPGDERDIALVPMKRPRYGYPKWFEWHYAVAYRRPGSDYFYEDARDKAWAGPWDFGLIDASHSGPNWDEQTSRANNKGEGIFLYEPASDDPEICPGADWSRYECSLCGKFVTPFCNDQGDLICPTCEATGLVITQIEVLDRLEAVREFARSMGLSQQLERQLCFMARHWSGEKTDQCMLGSDFAPHSFTFARYILPAYARTGQRTFSYNGAMIYQGPDCPADGSFPSLTVSLASGTGWFCHT